MNSPQLDEADKRAIDMLLDRLPSSSAAAAAGYTASSESIADPARLSAARGLLSKLDAWDNIEPPTNLVARTLAFIAQSAPTAGMNADMGASIESLHLQAPSPHSAES